MSPTDPPGAGACFPADEVRALLLGRASEIADRLARHISGCASCAAVAEAISLDPGVASGLRREHLPPPPSDHELADVVARVSRISCPPWSRRGSGAPAPVEVPGRLGPYRLVERLGAGGMGVVYRAEDTTLHRFVAVKVVKGGVDADTRARFLSEARALAAVRHDNVVTVHYVGEEPTPNGALPYLAMELLEGQTLRDWVAAAPPLAIEWVVRAGRQIAAGLAFAHDAGLVHRDVKPANLWLEAPQGWVEQAPGLRPPLADVGRVKLLDFGLAHPPGLWPRPPSARPRTWPRSRPAARPSTPGRICSGSAVCSTNCVRADCPFPSGAGTGSVAERPRRRRFVRSIPPSRSSSAI
ncbi:serine threonine protein partial : Serine/threonine protein kinase (Fragment) OS=Rhodopirellula maiorica SM1 GN=RMSM_03539 PE=4 SV=1: Pkinase [Gemmata massiliana]|uniref:Protein kinase domain-containing protein n=1 Tax=Gemmata massiliana TaxID=1210884 RepID=A0A6P2CUT5_9BACT